jgi:alkylation response protein AidB-like acyl-CoA dehydrogenase
MQLEPTSDQTMMTDMFARFLDAESSMERVRAALPLGFDPALWAGLAEQGALSMRVPEDQGGLGLGIFDAGLLMEQAGRTLASGPLAEAIVAGRLLAILDPEDRMGLRGAVITGEAILTIAMHDAARKPWQLVAAGAVAHAVILREGDSVFLLRLAGSRAAEKSLASTAVGRISLDAGERFLLGQGERAVALFGAALEEWKLLIALALAGLSREALRIAAAYACERQQFGRPIGGYQAIAHPLASLAIEADAGRLMAWRAIRAVADGDADAGEQVLLAYWWACNAAEKVVAQALHTFGGYGLTLEYDIHLFNLRAKAWPLVAGDPNDALAEAARRRYRGARASLPDAGPMPVEFSLGEDAEALAQETRELFERVLTPELRAKAHYSFDGHDPYVHRKLGEAGLLFPNWPKEFGGRGASPYALEGALRAWDEFGWTTHARGTCNIVGFIMNRFGTDELRGDALAKVITGEATCALGFSEPGSGSDVFAAKTRATPDGNGWRIDGQKMFTSGAESADYVLMLARTDPEAPKHKGLTMFIVPLKAEGVTIQAVHTFQDERTNITYYDGVCIPDSWRLGEVGGGLKVMATSLEIEHGMTFAREHDELLHSAEKLCRMIDHGDGKLIDEPAAQVRLTRCRANQLAAQVLHYRILWVSSEGKENLAYGPASKMFSSEIYRTDAADLLNLTAPESLAYKLPEAAYINQCYRHSQVATVYGGTSEVHRSMVAEKQLGLPRTR